MQVTEADRERVLRELRERFAADALSSEEFDRRVTEAFAAKSRTELEALVPEEQGAAVPVPAQSASSSARHALEARLAPGEWIEWAGAPDPTKRFSRGDVFLVPFSVMWFGFALFWEGAVIAKGSPGFILWGLPFVAVGLYMTVGRFIYKARRRRRTAYAVTNRRVMSVVQRRSGAEVDARYLTALSSISTTTDARGRGTVQFDNSGGGLPGYMADSGMGFLGNVDTRLGLGFFDIEDAAGVAALVERLSLVDECAERLGDVGRP